MAKWEFSGTERKGPIVTKRADYDTATGIAFFFPGCRCGFQVPDDVTLEETVTVIEQTAKALKERKSIIFMPERYAKERREWIKKMQEEDNLNG